MEIFGKELVLIIADILSFITILLCLVSKVPQIKTLVDNRSAKGTFAFLKLTLATRSNSIYCNIHIAQRHASMIFIHNISTMYFCCLILGISLLALYLELFSYTTMMSYNYYSRYAILSYLEYPMLLIQEYVLVFLVLKYNEMLNQRTYIIAGAYFFIFCLILVRFMPSFLFTMLVVSRGRRSRFIVTYNAVTLLIISKISVRSPFVHRSERQVKFCNYLKLSGKRIPVR